MTTPTLQLSDLILPHSKAFRTTQSPRMSFLSPPNTVFDDPFNIFDNFLKSFITLAIVVSIVSVVGTIVVVLLVMKYVKKNGLPSINVNNSGSNGSTPPAPAPQPFLDLQDPQIKMETVERFLNEIAGEKPIRFSPQQLAGFTRNYVTKLGSGGFGSVYKGELSNGVPVAVKVLNGALDKRMEEQFMAEVGTMGRTYHVNLVKLYGFCLDTKVTALVYEFMENGSLDKYLFNTNYEIKFQKLHDIAVGTAKAIRYLHEECQQRIIHYDIKPANILLDSSFNPKVADFGLAKLCNRDSTHVSKTGLRGTPGYAAPEMWMPFPVTCKCDVYSFGMLLFELVGRRRNHDLNMPSSQEWLPKMTWEKLEDGKLEEMALQCIIVEEDKEKAMRMFKVALWCVQYLPESRPPISEVVKMLEGEMEIASPANPFQHLQSSGSDRVGSGMNSVSTMVTSETREDDHNTALAKNFEIEICSLP